MSKRVLWERGMRLTNHILTLSDDCVDKQVSIALVLGACGRFGLFPSERAFNLSVDISDNILDVVSLNCLGLTRNGSLIDIEYDSAYTNPFNLRTTIPTDRRDTALLLCIATEDELIDTHDGFCQPATILTLIEENSIVPDNMLPIGRIVYDEYCWRMDDCDYLPPCLFLSSHSKYEKLCEEFKSLLAKLNTLLPKRFKTESNDALKIMWPAIQQLLITIDKESDVMTPMQLFGNLQKCISSFVCACTLDNNIDIADPEPFLNYIHAPYDFKNVYQKIKEGLELSASVILKVENFTVVVPDNKPKRHIMAPSIEKNQKYKLVKFGSADIIITNNTPGSIVYYTTDGSTPTIHSNTGTQVTIESGFSHDWHKEPAKHVNIKAISVLDGITSDIASFDIEIRKGNPFLGKEI